MIFHYMFSHVPSFIFKAPKSLLFQADILRLTLHEIVVDDSSMIGFHLIIDESEQNMPGIHAGLLAWHTRALTNELQ